MNEIITVLFTGQIDLWLFVLINCITLLITVNGVKQERLIVKQRKLIFNGENKLKQKICELTKKWNECFKANRESVRYEEQLIKTIDQLEAQAERLSKVSEEQHKYILKCKKAMQHFITKCDTGRPRNKESYQQFKTLLEKNHE